ncbi:MAG: stage 0 sporulation family protein [Mogibacterium sp.]|nr:stage 0 sporulation family protein [Mogibacterium sp.]
MTEIVGVGFSKTAKTYYFDPAGVHYDLGDLVIVETARGMELGHISISNTEVDDSRIVAPLKGIERKATKEDLKRYKENLAKREETMEICQKKIEKHGLEMKLIDAEYTIDGSKVIFYFSADGRIDFRELVKDLAARFKMRIELRQIGVRDEAKMLGGIGICGRPLCCSKWLHDFQPVSIKMAKQQNLSLNPSKISGSCGRLMCCLNFENKTYTELKKGMPTEGDRIETPDGAGRVVAVDIFNGTATVRMIERDRETGEETLSQDTRTYFKHEFKRIEKGRKKKHNDLEVLDEDAKRELEKLAKEN